jgi:hypothetical protein
MVYLVAVCAAAALGLGWVLQQRIAAQVDLSEMLSIRMLLDLMRSGVWWAGIAAMAAGQSIAGFALQLGPVTVVGPLLSGNLLFAFIIRAVTNNEPPRRRELIGAVLLCVAVAVFLAVAHPRASHRSTIGWQLITVSALITGVVVTVLVLIGKRRGLIAESILLATAAGILYGMQDATTRGGLVVLDRHDVAALIRSVWPYLLLGSAVIGVLLAQSAFRAARLDYSLPPITIAEPLVAGALGVTLLGDELSTTPASLAIEFLCIVGMIASALLVGRSRALAPSADDLAREEATSGRR